jgi:hypothetical protein
VTRPGTALAARTAPAALRFRDAAVPPDGDFACRRPPAWTVLEAKRNPISATGLRASRL